MSIIKVTINNNTLKLITGDITEQSTDVIVNAANGTLLGGGGVDGAIHRKAGSKLLEECKIIRETNLNGELLATGEVVITSGYNLPAKYIIHTVGPVWGNEGGKEADLLRHCYENAFELVQQNNLKSISFPSISTGAYSYPIQLASKIALDTIVNFLRKSSLNNVIITLFSTHDYQIYKKTLKQLIEQENNRK